jgi:hypothetical protein
LLQEEDFLQSNLLQHGGTRPQEERRGCFAEFYCSLEEGFLGQLLQRYSDFRREGNFQESKLSGFWSGGIQNMQSTSENYFFCSGSILFTQSTTCVFCSAGNPPPSGNPGLKRSRMDDILKNFEFKMNLNDIYSLPNLVRLSL